MFSLIFEEFDGEKIMLPLSHTAFEEKKNPDGTAYVIAYFNSEKFQLRCTLNEILHQANNQMRMMDPLLKVPPGFNVK